MAVYKMDKNISNQNYTAVGPKQGGFNKCFEEQGQTLKKKTQGVVKLSANSAGDHFAFYFCGFSCFVATLDV